MTGTDPATAFRGRYASRREAMQAIREHTGRGSVQAITENVTAEMGMPEAPIARAGRGDVVLVKRVRDSSLGLVALNGHEVIVTSARGLWRLPLSQALRAWRV